MSETEVLMAVTDFSGRFSRNHFLEGGFNWGGGCFSVSGFILKWTGCPVWAIGFDVGGGGGGKKIIGWGGGATPHYGKPCNGVKSEIPGLVIQHLYH